MTRGTYAKWYPQKSCGPEQGLREKHKEKERKKEKKAEMELMQRARQINTEKINRFVLPIFGFLYHLAQSLVHSQCLVKNKSCMHEKDSPAKRL